MCSFIPITLVFVNLMIVGEPKPSDLRYDMPISGGLRLAMTKLQPAPGSRETIRS